MKAKSALSIEELREQLARQILELALQDDNAQFKLDSYKATQKPPERGAKSDAAAPADAMSIFQARVRKASNAAEQ